MEEWKNIPGYGYQASNFGNIRNTLTKRLLKPHHVTNGYSQVRLSLGSREEYKVCRVHRLVALAWIPNPNGKLTVNHKDKNKYNNHVSNLEWSTHQEQSQHSALTTKGHRVEKYDICLSIDNEEWRCIPSCEGYFASNMGRVRNPQGKILKGHTSSTYKQMRIIKGKHIYVHRVVAEAFLPQYNSDCVVNHKDGNRFNNVIENLECITQKDNILHAYDTNLLRRRIGIVQRTLHGDFLGEFPSYLEATRQTGCKDSSIRWAIKHNDGKHGGYIWEIKGNSITKK
jgi:hypothetical protein